MIDFPLATIPATEVRTLRSAIVDQEYLISVALPFRYHEFPEKTYPVIYVLDANLYFGMVVEMVRTLSIRVPFCNPFPDAIIVGVGYPAHGSATEAYAQVTHLRMRDFLPVRDEGAEGFIQDVFPVSDHVASGGADHFLQFIQQELVPWIESAYRIDTADRTLMGFSWGGLFALYALFHEPLLFQRYVVASPDLPHGNGFILDAEQKYAEQHAHLPVCLYLAYGEPEINEYERPFLERFLDALKGRAYADFTLTYEVIPKYTHCAVVAPAFLAGLLAVFA
jgi:hypothetical protein